MDSERERLIEQLNQEQEKSEAPDRYVERVEKKKAVNSWQQMLLKKPPTDAQSNFVIQLIHQLVDGEARRFWQRRIDECDNMTEMSNIIDQLKRLTDFHDWH